MKSAWSNSALLKLVTWYEKLEDEIKNYEKDMKEENRRRVWDKTKRASKRKNQGGTKDRQNYPSKETEEEGWFINIRKTNKNSPKKNHIETEERQISKRAREQNLPSSITQNSVQIWLQTESHCSFPPPNTTKKKIYTRGGWRTCKVVVRKLGLTLLDYSRV